MSEQHPSSTPVIERIPTTEELKAQFSLQPHPNTFEAVSPHFAGAPEWDSSAAEEAEAPVERKLLSELSDELQFGPDAHRDVLTRNAYAVTRQLADKAIARKSREGFALV